MVICIIWWFVEGSDTNRDVRDAEGNCINATMNFSRTVHGDDLFRIYKGPWSTWPQPVRPITF